VGLLTSQLASMVAIAHRMFSSCEFKANGCQQSSWQQCCRNLCSVSSQHLFVGRHELPARDGVHEGFNSALRSLTDSRYTTVSQ